MPTYPAPKPPYVGDVRTFTARWRKAGAYIAPDTVEFDVTDPNGAMTAYVLGAMGSPVVQVEEGVYTLDVPFTVAGRWFIVAKSTGAGQAIDVISVLVRPLS